MSQHKYPFHSSIGNKRRQRRLLLLRGYRLKHATIVVFFKTFHNAQIKRPVERMLRLDQIVCNQNTNRSGLFVGFFHILGTVAHLNGSLFNFLTEGFAHSVFAGESFGNGNNADTKLFGNIAHAYCIF
ncbi:hypothetical protein SDC9_133671 [bioreactor metagenome]|uniref:Uncharacterized protein n=1 Tax=bioreactor metagenome TaxID=1076179 RepID=A0A645DDE3_9ZZZZ